jgi:hypothetical protein
MRLDLPTLDRPANATSAMVGGGELLVAGGRGVPARADGDAGPAGVRRVHDLGRIELALGHREPGGWNAGLHSSHWQSERRYRKV